MAVFYYFGLVVLTVHLLSSPPTVVYFHNEDWLKEEEKAAWHQFLAGVKTDLESVLLLSLETKKKKKEESTRFRQIDAVKSVWFYEHKQTFPFSSMSARHFDGCSTVKHEKKKVSIASECTKEHQHHYLLTPFLFDNHGCRQRYNYYLSQKAGAKKQKLEELVTRVTTLCEMELIGMDLTDCHVCPAVSNSSGFSFTENDWTLRLQRNLDAFLGAQYTSHYLATKGQTFRQWQSVFSSVTSSWHYLFYGAPDILITNKSGETSASIQLAQSLADNMDNSSDQENLDVSSEDEAVEITKIPSEDWQCPLKVGELLAQLHFLAVAKYTRKIVKGTYPTSVTTRGAIIDRQLGVVHVSITLDSSGFRVEINHPLMAETLTEERLCEHLHHLVSPEGHDLLPPSAKKKRVE